jgi:hypothetical protein
MVPIASIVVPPDRPPRGDVDALAESIKNLKLLIHPITVTEDLRLVAGRDRLEACRSLGWTEVPATVLCVDALQAELAEIDENLVRKVLTYLERSEQAQRRKKIYEALHPETRHVTKRGGPGRGKKTTAKLAAVSAPAFTADTAKKTGRSVRSVRRDIQIVTGIAEPVRHKIRGTPLADRKDDLERIARMDPEQQVKVVDTILASLASPKPLTVPQAERQVADREKLARMKAKAAEAKAAGADGKGSAWTVNDGRSPDALRLLERGSVRQVVTDPPYNIGENYGSGPAADRLPRGEFLRRCAECLTECYDLLTDDGSLWLVFRNDENAEALGMILAGDAVLLRGPDDGAPIGLAGGRKFHVRARITWFESFGNNCANNFNSCSRRIFYCVKDPKNFVFNADAVRRVSDRAAKYGDKRADPSGKIWDDVWGINPPINRMPGNDGERIPGVPNQLPLDLLKPIVGCSSDPGDLVLDPFSGMASTGDAALRLGRRYLGIEQNAHVAELSRQRLAVVAAAFAASGRHAVLA